METVPEPGPGRRLRIAQVTDLHLSQEFPLFLLNWEILAERLRELAPDLVLMTGDVGLSDPDREQDLAFARGRLDALGLPWLAIPGNHDIGETPRPGYASLEHPTVTSERRQRFVRHFGEDGWTRSLEGWLLLGLNAQLLGSGLPDEAEHRRWIEDSLAAHSGDAVLVASHKTLFSTDAGADEPGWSIPQVESRWLEGLLGRFRTKVLISGHLHREKRYTHAGIDCIWGPSTAFFASHPRIEKRKGRLRVGALLLTLSADAVEVEHIGDDRLLEHDARNWFNPGVHALWRIVNAPSPFLR